ncbi:MAG: restriction endonuclease [Candidatus Aenigmatarchaeota archaeon]
MPNKYYVNGVNFERRIKKDFENKGYFVIRSAGSKSPIDLVAIKEGIPVLIQCKTKEVTKEEIDELRKLRSKVKCKVLIVVKRNRKINYLHIS